MLLDDILNRSTDWEHFIDPKHVAHVRKHGRSAVPYVFDSEASSIVGRFVQNCPDVLETNEQFAIPPYDVIDYFGKPSAIG